MAQIEFFIVIAPQKLVGTFVSLALLGFLELLPTFAAESETVTVPVAQDKVQRLEITVDSYSFTPNRFAVKENIPVELIFKSVTWIVPHNFVLKSAEAGIAIEKEIGPGETTNVRFTPTRTGEYRFSCTKQFLFFPSHEALGMVGTLVVGR